MKKSGNNQGGNNGRDSDKNLSALYEKLSTELPPGKLDETILSAAHQNIKSGKRKKISTSPFSSNWVVPLSLAATVILSVSIILTLPDDEFQRIPESEMRRLETQIPGSAEAEKPGPLNQVKPLKSTVDRKQTSVQSPTVKEEKKDVLLFKKELAKQKPAMVPAESVAPASIAPASEAPMRSMEEADLAAPRMGTSGAITTGPQDRAQDNTLNKTQGTTRARSAKPKKAVQKEKMKAKAGEKPAASKKTFANIGKVKPGMNKQAVFELLGEPYKKTNTSWLYRIVENNQAQNYTITFENNQVITVEMVAPALRKP